MQRKNAFATAGAASMIVVASVVGLGANVGLFGLDAGPQPGQFKLVDNTGPVASPVRTEVVDVPVPVPAAPAPASAPAASAPAPQRTAAPRPAVSAAPAAGPSVASAPAPTSPPREPGEDPTPGGDTPGGDN